ncbi:DUF7504 family protein [Haloplanus aerogenes]|uniref:Uncharacterized protein n=1 Tax=Haloplanus aerogenes TaxID=660522 RepID=A0A3M0DPR2_9EURY|nr:hypothetical protein [Haloplanus aerogenes]AZH24637.1 hypothetical protein DU502_04220 [Haloplanus aerogenes]RMB23707.1 hypothetical protein ATH50_0932 [Haloplanus aerogenes]
MSTLHLTERRTAIGARQCARAVPEPNGADVLVVAFAGSPARWLDGWQAAVGAPPRATFVVNDAALWIAGDPRERIESVAAPDTAVRTELVDSPGNLTDLGVTLTEALEAHAARDRRTVLCLQSLTVLLQYSPLEQVCQFLHTLVGHLKQFDATGHFHLHEHAHDEEAVATLRSMFDRIQ